MLLQKNIDDNTLCIVFKKNVYNEKTLSKFSLEDNGTKLRYIFKDDYYSEFLSDSYSKIVINPEYKIQDFKDYFQIHLIKE